MCLRVSFFFLFFFSQVTMAEYLSEGELPPAIASILDALAVERRGASPEGFMLTHGFTGVVSPNKSYRLTADGLAPVSEELVIPRHVNLQGRWLSREAFEEDKANILGDSGRLILSSSSLVIPEARATSEALEYYNSKLLTLGQGFTFGGLKDLPVADMTMGRAYVEEYLLRPEHGGGAYLEWHDNPHFHRPKDEEARGFLILGKKISKDLYRLSAFRIPYGCAIYTGPYVIHADSFLVGNYEVVYSTSRDYSTVILKNRNDQIVSVSIGELE